jgi:hypothetical protein
MKLREIDSSDVAAFKTLRLAALRECPTAFSSSYEEEHDIPPAEAAQRLAPDRDRAIFGAFDGDHLVATVGLQRESRRKLAHKAVYESLGFEPFGLERGFLRVDGVLHDELHMVLTFREPR